MDRVDPNFFFKNFLVDEKLSRKTNERANADVAWG